jgi:hypothetical protein
VYYFYFSSIEIIDIKSTPDCLAIIIIPHSTSNLTLQYGTLIFIKFIMNNNRIGHTSEIWARDCIEQKVRPCLWDYF